MAKLNTVQPGRGAASPLQTVQGISAKTYEGGPAFASNVYTEAFRLGVNLLAGGEDTYYEKGAARDKRFNDLMSIIAVADPSWAYNFLVWLRNEGNIRTAAIMGAAHAVHARLANTSSVTEDELLSSIGQLGINRALVRDVCARADEPGEFMAYYMRTFGALPKAVKRGLADAANKLYTDYSVMKYDTASHGVRFADVLNLTHASPKFVPPSWQVDKLDEEESMDFFVSGNLDKVSLFQHIVNRRFGNAEERGTIPAMIQANMDLRAEAAVDPSVLLNADRVKAAGMTWEDVLSLAGSRVPKNKLWEAVIPSMGYMALLRNLRNFEESGISEEMHKYVTGVLTDPKKVARSRQFPFRFLSAFEQVNSLRYKAAIEEALNLAVKNIPELKGQTLILVDTSGSMSAAMSNHSKMTRAGVAALYGAALANKNAGNVDLVMFATESKKLEVPKGGSILSIVDTINRMNGHVGHGTQTAEAVMKNFKPGIHKRVIIVTDCQSFGSRAYGYFGYGSNCKSLGDLLPASVPMYSYDLSGYKFTDLETGPRRHQFGGITDHMFKLIPLLEAGDSQDWPWVK